MKIDIGWCDPGYVNGHFALSIVKQAADMQYFGLLGDVHAAVSGSLISTSRNYVVREFMKGESDYLWFIDSDIVVDKGHGLKLLDMANETNAEMVTGLAFMFKRPANVLVPSIFYPSGEDSMETRLELPENGQKIVACGLSSVLIHRKVFEALEPPRHEEYRWFDQIVLPSGLLSGEDTQFFWRAREKGFTLRVNTSALTKHVKEVGMGLDEYNKQMGLNDET